MSLSIREVFSEPLFQTRRQSVFIVMDPNNLQFAEYSHRQGKYINIEF